MKTIVLIAASALLSVSAAAARPAGLAPGSSGPSDFGHKAAQRADHERGNDVTVTVAGYELDLGSGSRPAGRTYRKRYTGHIPLLEAGFNMLPSAGYKIYPAGCTGFMDLNNARSFNIAVNALDVAVPLNHARTLGLSIGLGIAWNDFVLSDKIGFVKRNGRLEPYTLDGSYKKSKINTFALRIPVMFEWNLPRGFYVGLGGYGSALLGSHTKIKFPKEKMRAPYTRPFEVGVTGRIGYRWISIYCNRALTSLFKAGRGPKVYTTTIGIGIDI